MEQMKAWFVQTQQECLQQLAAARDEKLREKVGMGNSLRKKVKPGSRSRRKELAVSSATKSDDGTIAGVGVKSTGDHQCSNCWQKFDTEQAKKLHYRIDKSDFPQFEKQKDLRSITGVRKTVPDQPIHDRARSKPDVIDEAGTSGEEAQTISLLPQHAQVWLPVSTKNSRIKIGAQRRTANHNLRRDTDKQGKRALPKKREEKSAKNFSRRSRKESNKFKKAENGNTNELTLISANVTLWKKNFNEIARLNPDIMALQETKVTKAARPAANRAAGSEKLSVVWRKPCDQFKNKREGKLVAETPWMGRQGGVAVLAKKKLGILAGGMEGKASCELYESARYVRAAIPVRHGNRKLFVPLRVSTTRTQVTTKSSKKREMKEHWREHSQTRQQSGTKHFSCAQTSTCRRPCLLMKH